MATYGVLGTEEIRHKLYEIFKPDTASEGCIDAASYNLRVAADCAFFGGNWHPRGDEVYSIVINPGEIAVLSTIEEFTLPKDLVGSVNVKFKYTQKGLLSLFGSRVDPGFDQDNEGRRLYLFVCNIGSEKLTIKPGDTVFIVEFSIVTGEVKVPKWSDKDKEMDLLLKEKAASGERQLGFLGDYVKLRNDYDEFKREAETFREDIEKKVETLKETTGGKLQNLRDGMEAGKYIGLFAYVVLAVAFASQLAPIGIAWWQRHLDAQPVQKAAQVYSDTLVPIGWPVISLRGESVKLRRLPGDSPLVDDILVVYRLISGKRKSLLSRSDLEYVGTLRIVTVEPESVQAAPVARTSLEAIRLGDFALSMETSQSTD